MTRKVLKLIWLFLMMANIVRGGERTVKSNQFFLYVGAYTQSSEEGIYLYLFDAGDGDLKYISTSKGVKNPSYLAIHPKKNVLIAVNEIGEYKGERSGALTSFSIDPANGSLRKLNQIASGGGSPCYVSINRSGSHGFVANYSGGNVAMFSIRDNGSLGPITNLKQHTGSGPVKERQKGPHAHAIVPDPKDNFALAVDLGIDRVISYKVDYKTGSLNGQSELTLVPGAGPRHLTFHPGSRLAFVISELNSTIGSYAYDKKTGTLREIMTVYTVPSEFTGKNSCADVHVSPNGKFLYGSNRGHDSIVIFQIDQKTGALTYVSHHSVRGKTPRNFMIDPTGKFLLVANQNSDNIVVFKIDPETGMLKSNGVEVQVSKPVCLKMLAVREF